MTKYAMNYNIFYICLLMFSVAIVRASERPFKYNLNPCGDECGPVVIQNSMNQALACMKKGFTSIFLGVGHGRVGSEVEFVAPELRDFYFTLNRLTMHEAGYYILYTNAGVRNALLIKKLFLDEIYAGGGFLNDYLLGILLGYAEDDMLFYYQAKSYLKNISYDPFPDMLYPLNKWPQEKQDAFHAFVEKGGPWKVKYNRDKAIAEKWLKENEQYSIEDLVGYNKNFFQALQPSLLERVSAAFGQVSTSVKSAISRTVNYLFPSHK